MKIKFWVVQTPTGDRPYVSVHKPQSYIDHLDASGEKAEVYEVDVVLPPQPGDWIIGSCVGLEMMRAHRVR